MNASPLFKGCATALVTPFLPDGGSMEAALRRLIAMQLDSQIDALVLLGTTGETLHVNYGRTQAHYRNRA